MSDALAHRGPDAAGTWTGPDDAERVRLGHRRLSIIDLSAAANQPFVKDGLVLVFNGEIYNYRQLRAELGGAGISFRTSSDTEVLLEAWRRWGPASLRRLPRHVRLRAVRRAPGHTHPGPRPVRHQAAVLDGAGRRRGLRLGAQGAAAAARGAPADRPHGHRGLPAVLLDPRGPLRLPGRPQAPTGELAGGRPGRPPAAGAVLRPPGRVRRAVRAAGRRGGAAPPARGLGRRAPGGRRAHLHLPVRRAGLQPAHRPGRPPQPRHRLLHDLVPAGGPAPGGHARRPGLRPQVGRPARHQAARGRDRPRRGRPAPAHGADAG